jgi:hypothetical protein
MHPIYNRPGAGGRQLILPATKTLPERLAWGHTLCCFGLQVYDKTGECLTPCKANGEAMGISQSHVYHIDDDDSANSTLLEAELDACSIHHFAFCSPKSETWYIIKEHQYELRCNICGDDNGEFQVPVQCSWNDENEFEVMRDAKRKLSSLQQADRRPCTFSTHLGCAVWGRNANREYFGHRRVFFMPAVTDLDGRIDSHAAINIFCDEHAQELHRCQASGCNNVRHPRHFRITHQKFVAAAPPTRKASSSAKTANDKPRGKRRAKTAETSAVKKKSRLNPIKTDALVDAPVNDLVDTPPVTGSPERDHRPAKVDEREQQPSPSNTSAGELDDWTTDNDVEAFVNSAEPAPQLESVGHEVDDTLCHEAVREILRLEEDGRYPHLQDILESAQSRWKTRLATCSPTTFQTFWKHVTNAVYDSLEFYSAQPTDWTFLEDPKAAEAWASEWDEVEVVQLGQPPPQLNRR